MSIFHMNPLFCIIGSLCFKNFFLVGGGGEGEVAAAKDV